MAGTRKAPARSSSRAPAKGKHGGRRVGAGRRPLTPEQRLEQSIAASARDSALITERVARLLEVTDLSPRRQLLAHLAMKGRRGRPSDPGVRTDGPWIAGVIEATCVQVIGRWKGLPLILEPWQRLFLDDALTFDELGEYVYGTSLLGVPRKNGKTTGTAALAVVKLSPCDGEGQPEVLLAAGSREQTGPLLGTATAFVNGSELLREVLVTSATDIKCPGNAGFLECLAGDGKLNHGRNPYFTAADELHAWTTPRQGENWNALTTADGARDDALLMVLSTAGVDRRTVLGELYEQAYASPFRVDVEGMGDGGFKVLDPESRLCVHWYAIGPRTELDDLDAWKRANPASWRTKERIRRDLAKRTVDEPAKRRLYGNVWTAAKHAWLPGSTWTDLVDDAAVKETLVEGARVGVAVDASLNHDLTAVATAAPTDDGRIAVRVRTFSVRRDAPAHVYFAGSTIDLGTVKRYIAGGLLGIDADLPWQEVVTDVAGDVTDGTDLFELFDVAVIGFDPRYFSATAKELELAGATLAVYDPRGKETWEAVQSFYNLAVGGELAVEADDVLAQHVAAAAGEKTDKGWRVSKLKAAYPIDGLIAAILAVDLAVDGLDDDEPSAPWATVWE